MDEVATLLAEIKDDLLRKDETYALVADLAPCDGCKGTGRVMGAEASRPCSFCKPYQYFAFVAKVRQGKAVCDKCQGKGTYTPLIHYTAPIPCGRCKGSGKL